jgi:hypothetical protein
VLASSSPLSSSNEALDAECATGDYAAQSIPDIVSSLRVDQAWGSAQISGALHQVRGNFYGNDSGPGPAVGPAQFTGVRPSDVWGWAVAAGTVLNLPWNPGDKFSVEGNYSQGAPCYVGLCQQGHAGTFYRFNGDNVATAWALDGVFANTVGQAATGLNGSGIILSTAWSIDAAVEHYWTPALRTSVFGSAAFWTPGAKGNDIMCSSPVGPVRTSAGATPTFLSGPVNGCDFGFSLWQVGSRGVWNPVKNLDIGVEVMYTKLHTNFDPGSVRLNFGGAGGRPAGLYTPSDEGVWSGMLRVQRNFWP